MVCESLVFLGVPRLMFWLIKSSQCPGMAADVAFMHESGASQSFGLPCV